MFEVRNYMVLEGADALGQPLVEVWVEYLPGVDGFEPVQSLTAQREGNTLHIPDLSRSLIDLNENAWRLIDITGDGAVVVCGPGGVVWRALWQLQRG